jgi:hypothetical protein
MERAQPSRAATAPSFPRILRASVERRGLLVVSLAAVALAIWRLRFVLGGIDPDSDAYGHHAIARQILEDPRDLTVHWVWLPFFHYAQALFVAASGTMQGVRLVNVVLSAIAPIALYLVLRVHREARPDPRGDGSALIAAIVTALSPIAMQMGTTAQTEPLFALLVIATVAALDRGRPLIAAAALVVAVLLRYEAWAIPPAIAVFLLLARVPFVRARLHEWEVGRATDGLRAWAPVVLPVLAIVAWAAIRRATCDATWFAFLHETRSFANGALGSKSAFDRGVGQVAIDLGYYTIKIPWRVIGYSLVLAPFGIARTFRTDGLRFVAIHGALLSFVTLTWLMRSSLGLDRHFVVLVPFYATLIANGIVSIGGAVDALLVRPTRASVHAFAVSGAARAAIVAGLAVAVTADHWLNLKTWMRDWRGASEAAWPDRRAIARALALLAGPQTVIFCDEPTVEILTGLDRRLFQRRMLGDPRAVGWIADAVSSGRPVYVATWASRLGPLGLSDAAIVARTPETTGDAGFVLVRVGVR